MQRDDLTQQLEYVAGLALPAAVQEHYGGWQFGFNWGVTRRANSVLPNDDDGRFSVVEKIAYAEQFYTRWKSPVYFKITPAMRPANLDALLEARGYTAEGKTAVQILSLSQISSPSTPLLGHVSESFSEPWFACYCAAEQFDTHTAETRRAIINRIQHGHCGYATVQQQKQIIAVGFGMISHGWLGIFSMTTLPMFRRQGAATAILLALLQWGTFRAAKAAYLQVVTDNQPAMALYARLGFETAYHYHYRKKTVT